LSARAGDVAVLVGVGLPDPHDDHALALVEFLQVDQSGLLPLVERFGLDERRLGRRRIRHAVVGLRGRLIWFGWFLGLFGLFVTSTAGNRGQSCCAC